MSEGFCVVTLWMSIWLIGCLKESEGPVRSNQVLIGQVRTGEVKTDQVKTY